MHGTIPLVNEKTDAQIRPIEIVGIDRLIRAARIALRHVGVQTGHDLDHGKALTVTVRVLEMAVIA